MSEGRIDTDPGEPAEVYARVESIIAERDALRARVARLEQDLAEMTRRTMGHAYTAAMAEGGETIQAQELARERREHAETRARVERLEGALREIAADCALPGEVARGSLTKEGA